ncbi:MAG: ribonuclease HII [bacterium]
MKKIQSPEIPIKKGLKKSKLWLIGIDEVGRGPLAGPVTLCAFGIQTSDSDFRKNFSTKYPNLILNDSKKITEKKREQIDKALRNEINKNKTNEPYKFLIKSKSAKDIDKLGISICIHEIIKNLLKNFIKSLGISEGQVCILLDGGLKAPPEFVDQETHIKGDVKFAVISAASILAKVHRDRYMRNLLNKDKNLAKYGFDIHKGYGTKKHIESIKKNGLSKEHRITFLKKLITFNKI